MMYVRGKHVGGLRETSADFVVCLLCGRAPSDPKLLSCLHTFCAPCLRQRASDTGICCPTCQEQTPLDIPAGGVAALPTDYLAVNFQELERLRRGQQVMTCDTCGGDEEADEATHRCVACQIFLCEVHVVAHRKARKTCNHELQSAVEIRQRNASVPIRTASDLAVVRRPLTCHVRGHEEKQLELFCADCSQLVCRDCILVEHREHNYSFVRDAGNEQRQQVAKNLEAIKETSARMCEVKRAVHSRQEELSKGVEELTDRIRQTADMHRKRLDQREKALLERLGELCRPKARILEDQSDRLARFGTSLDHCADVVSRVLELGSNEELITVKTSLVSRMISLTRAGTEEPTYPLDDGALTFSFSKDCVRAIDELGVLETKPCAWTSHLTTPPTVCIGQAICSTVVLQNSLSEPCSSTSSNSQPWANLQIMTRQAGNRLLKSTSHCVSCTELGECTIKTDLQNVCGRGTLEFFACLHQQNLVGSPASIHVLDPPWTLDPNNTLPNKNRLKHYVKISDRKLSFSVGIPNSGQVGETFSWNAHDGVPLARDSHLHLMADRVLDGSSPAECLRWCVRFKTLKPKATNESCDVLSSSGTSVWAVGVLAEGNVQSCLQQENRASSTYDRAVSRGQGQGRGMYHSRSVSGYPLYSLEHMRSYSCVRSDGLAFKSNGPVVPHRHRQIGVMRGHESEQITWSSEDTLQLELVMADLTLTVTNLSTLMSATIYDIKLPCRPVISVPIGDVGSEVMVEFP